MQAEPTDSTLGDDPMAVAHKDLRAEQLRLYDANTVSSQVGSAVIAALLVTVLWGVVPAGRLLGWAACLALAIGVRVLVGSGLRRRAPDASQDSAHLQRLRISVAFLGVVWGLAGALLFAPADVQHQVFLAFVLAGIAAGTLSLTSFDVVAALAFAVLALTPLSVRLLSSGESVPVAMAAMVLLFMAFLALTALRAFRNVRETVALRSAESVRADALKRSQRRLQELSGQLTRKTAELELTLGSMAQGILSLGSDGRTNFYNHRLLDLLDLPESFLETRPTMDDIARYQAEHGHFGEGLRLVGDSARGHLERWLAGDPQPFPEVYFRRTPSGRTLEVKSRYLPGGGLVRTFSDVTAYIDAQQRLRESEAQSRKLALVAANTDNAVFIADPQMRIEWVNEGFTRLTGYKLEEVAGKRPGDVLDGPDTDRAAAARLDQQLLEGKRATAELVNYTKDGRPYWTAIEMQPIVDEAGELRQYISIERDITQRKQAEAALRAAHDEAERANHAKSEFLSAMSHELRTPMNAILGFGQLLAADPTYRLPATQAGYVREILNAGRHLLELIDDVLDLARVEAGRQQIDIEPVPVSALVNECLTLMQPVARERGVRLPASALESCNCHVSADRTRLKQVLLNLLSNAIKYNCPNGSVAIACSADGDGLRISVSDTGPGLNAEQRERLFTAFDRLGAESSAIQGAGIGLVLCKRLAELMHGSIGVESDVGQGSTFWVRLARAQPVAPARARAQAAVPGPATAPANGVRTVLYIEDNPVNVLLMEAMLAHEPGVRLITAPLPELGLQMAQAQAPQLILLDIQLPGIDGYEVLRRLRAGESTRAIPVIAISANAMRGDIEQGLAAGFSDYLTKPLDLSRLLAVLRNTLHA